MRSFVVKHWRIFAGVLTFLFGVAAVGTFSIWLKFPVPTRSVCDECRAVSESEVFETKSVSEILDDRRYIGRRVRLKTSLEHDAGFLFLDPQVGRMKLWASFDGNPLRCSDTDEAFRICTGFGSWYDGSVDVTVIGTLSELPDRLEFKILCLEEVDASARALLAEKIRYELGQLLLGK